jgi:hypothetical protein
VACSYCGGSGGSVTPVANGPSEHGRGMEGDETEAVMCADAVAMAWSGGTAKLKDGHGHCGHARCSRALERRRGERGQSEQGVGSVWNSSASIMEQQGRGRVVGTRSIHA